MPTLYLHIGTPKTGTSAIQKFLPLNEASLNEKGFCYPDLGYTFPGIGVNRNGHFLVYRQKLKGEDRQKEKEIRAYEDERFYEGLDKLKEISKKYPNIILSDENIWNGYWKRENFWFELKNALTDRGIDLKVIVYLRRQDLLIESYWSQQVRETSQMSFKEYVDSDKYSYFKLDYFGRLEEISKAVGSENIIVRAYEKQQYNGGSLISDFLSVLGIELNSGFRSVDIVANTSLYGEFLEVKRILNSMECFRTKMNWAVKYLRAVQEEKRNSIGLSKCENFTYDEQVAFLKRYEEGNASVAEKYLNRGNGVLFYDEIPKRKREVQSYDKEDLVRICGRIMELQNNELEELKTKRSEDKQRIAELSSELKEVKRQMYKQRPLYRKIGGKIYRLFKR